MNKINQKKIGILHPHLIEGGGSEARALYMAEALKDNYDITIITTYTSGLKRLNHCFGTNLTSKDVKIIKHPLSYLFKRFKGFDAIRGSIFSRFCLNFIESFDLIISTYNTMNFNKLGIQFIADFSFSDRLRRKFDPTKRGLRNLIYDNNFLRRLYLLIGRVISGVSSDGFRKNLTIANSKWSARIMKEEFGIDCRVIYPPAIGKFPEIPWNEKEDGFVYIGRLGPEKRIEHIMEIIEAVRGKGWNLHLHIIGSLYNTKYVRKLKKLSKSKGKWVKLEGAKYGEEKKDFITRHKFGISGRQNEPFGIAVAEMVKAGCIVWVPKGGGQTEIVNQPLFIYNNVEDAVNKIEKVFKDETLQVELREHLAKQAERFSTERFKVEIKSIVRQFLSEK